MNVKKIIIMVLVILALLICGVLLFNTNVEVEYVPETEIDDVNLRKTMISLYFQNTETNQIQKETRLIDSKELLLDPYAELIEMLINGPESDSLAKLIPEGTKLLSAELVGDCLNINFSNDFIDKMSNDENDKMNCIHSIVDTVTELNEVNSVKILINGEEMEEFADEFLREK